MGHRRLTKKLVFDALFQTKGAVYLAAKSLGCSHTAVYDYIRKFPDVADLKQYYDEEATDIAELKLREAILHGEPWAIRMQLMTKGKSRGYVEKQEIANEGEVKVLIEYANDPYQVRPSSPGTIGGDSEPEAV